MGLLDLSARNRLLNTPRSSKNLRSIEIIDEKAAEIFRLLVTQERMLTFAPGKAARTETGADGTNEGGDLDEIADLAQPDDDSVDERGVLKRHADLKLQTRLTSKGLQKRLFEMHSDSVLLEQEQGVNILFLALGMLKWIDPNNAKNIRYAPLILIPVSLERGTAADRFKLKWRNEDQSSNLSLEAYLEQVHSLKMPVLETGEECDPTAYAAAVAETVSLKPGWEVLPDDIVLGFFSFAKFLMYRDLDAECWPEDSPLIGNPLLRSILGEGFSEPPRMIGEDDFVDPFVSPKDMLHVADCDSSQMLAVHEVRQGHSLVIQGPPGTGKSQTIANIIASAVADGKTVLFVAEKMVALDVVKRRLDRCGVGDACLELHSNKANKRLLLNELKRTWELGSPRGTLPDVLNQNLENERDVLNLHAAAMHCEHTIARMTPFEVVGELRTLLLQDTGSIDFELVDAPRWTPTEREQRKQLLEEFAFRIGEIGLPGNHPWQGIGLIGMLPTDVDRLVRRVAEVKRDLDALRADVEALAAHVQFPGGLTLSSLDDIRKLGETLEGAPALSSAALAASAWEDDVPDIMALLAIGAEHALLQGQLAGLLRPESSDVESATDHSLLQELDSRPGWDAEAFARLERLSTLIPELEEHAARLQERLGIAEAVTTIAKVRRLASTGKAVADAPAASPEAFASAVWNYGVDQAGEVADAVARLDAARRAVGDCLLPTAWETDLTAARVILARHGDGLLRHLSSEWRSADKLVRGFSTDPKLPLAQLLPVLDALSRGREARSFLEKEDAFGREAFGADWRGERSSPGALGALVTWMRSLKGLGAEARLVAARLPDREQFAPLSDRLEKLAREFSELYDAIPRVASGSSSQGLALGEMPLEQMGEVIQPIVDAEARTRALFLVVPGKLSERLTILAKLEALQQLRAKIRGSEALGLECFGERWRGPQSDWSGLKKAAGWLSDHSTLRLVAAHLAALPERGALLRRATSATAAREMWLASFSELIRDMKFESPSVMDPAKSSGYDLYQTEMLPLTELAERLQRWLDHPEQLSKWMAFRECEERIKGLSLEPVIERLCDGRIRVERVGHAFALAYYEALLREMLRQAPTLSRFDGSAHGRVVDRFAELDHSRIAASAIEVVQAHHRRIPVGGGVGPIGVLRGEIAKRARHLPIRQLMQKAAPVIQALKPVLMMSPLSVAQFLPPGKLTFDLLVMDEASQIQPVDALGAIARCRQLVVVGDERQLPPTSFFAKMTSNVEDEQEDDEDGTNVTDIESVLGLCIARGLPQRMLRWHYRSRHQSLIALSNSEFYENKLFIIPSPFLPEAGMGLRFHYVADGVFYPGKTLSASEVTSAKGPSAHQAANPVEALAVAEAVMKHAFEYPGQSIGVATFSMAQKRLIEQRIEELRRLHPEGESYFHAHPSEPFFVKNLENVQGDERDVILVSVGYGRDPAGKFAMRFGPLANDGGERRLNVLISRAKSRCEVYASITDEDIDTERARSRGVFALKLFLHFARTGRLDTTHSAGLLNHESAFIAYLAAALRERGYLLHEHVGVAGCFIDLAILAPDLPGRYVLGIECDGPGYRNARSARDRDRLRRFVLEDHDWILYRVWSLDWLHRPQEQMALLEAAIERARTQWTERWNQQADSQRNQALEVATVEREDGTEMALKAAPSHARNGAAYVEASEQQPSDQDIHDTPLAILTDLVVRIVAVEGPLHCDELAVRVRTVWGLLRTGQRIQAAVDRAVAAALHAGAVTQKESFLLVPGSVIVPRDRSSVTSLSLRKPEMLCSDEIDAAIFLVLRGSFGATKDELVHSCSRLFGYAATSTQLRSALVGRIVALGDDGRLSTQGELLLLSQTSTLP
jgi:hypothetical protein